MRVGDWVEITKYDGPIQNINVVGAVAKVVGVDKNDVSLLAVDLRVSDGYGRTTPLVVKVDEVKTIAIDARDANNVPINVGDEIAYAVWGGHLSQGKVVDIIPKAVSRYDYQEKKSVRKIEFSLRVNAQGSRSFANYSEPYDHEKSRRVSFDTPAIRRVDRLSRVLVVKQKDDPCVDAPKPVWPGGTQVFPSFPSQPLQQNPTTPWPGNGIRVTADSALTAQK